MLKFITRLLFYVFCAIFILPLIITVFHNKFLYEKDKEVEEIVNEVEFNTSSSSHLNNDLENYIIGVVAAEMPVSFEEEALKAQAIAARTYLLNKTQDRSLPIDFNSIGQAYISLDKMKANWGKNFHNYYNKVKKSVEETKGIIMTYENEPIEAVFHSTSAGITELPENIWGKSLPYIKSVNSKFDEKSPNFIYKTKIDNKTFVDKIYEKFKDLDKNKIISSFEISKRSEAGYVLEVKVLNKYLKGTEIRSMFNLRSSNFSIQKNEDSVEFLTKGYGHGAGMSQYGANFMAIDGKNYSDILNHYYSNIKLKKVY